MKKIGFISDVHGCWGNYFDILTLNNFDKSYQLGDMGIGFGGRKTIAEQTYDVVFPFPSSKHKFIRGNHDNPTVCRNHENYLGEYGMTEEGIFYCGGGLSIDRNKRMKGFDWWPDEELSHVVLADAIELYEKEKPEYVMTHVPPEFVVSQMSDFVFPSRTSRCFDMMLEIHKPKNWFFGHMHQSYRKGIFIGLGVLESYTLEI